jgi:hypothetical protein
MRGLLPEIRRRAARLGPLCLLAGLAAGAAGVVVAPAAAKPLPPLTVMWQVDSTPDPGGGASHRVTLTVTAREPFDDLAVEARVPAGFTLAEGTGRWRGALARDGAVGVAFVVRGPAAGRVPVEITGKTASNVHFSRTVAVDVPESHDKSALPAPPGPREPGPTPGIREFPGR